MKNVTPRCVSSSGLWNVFSGHKTWTIWCGGCIHTFAAKVPIVEPSSSICPACRSLNVWSARKFQAAYEAGLAERKAQEELEREKKVAADDDPPPFIFLVIFLVIAGGLGAIHYILRLLGVM